MCQGVHRWIFGTQVLGGHQLWNQALDLGLSQEHCRGLIKALGQRTLINLLIDLKKIVEYIESLSWVFVLPDHLGNRGFISLYIRGRFIFKAFWRGRISLSWRPMDIHDWLLKERLFRARAWLGTLGGPFRSLRFLHNRCSHLVSSMICSVPLKFHGCMSF